MNNTAWLVLSGVILLLIGVLVLLPRWLDLRVWNRGRCPHCGQPWHDASSCSWDWEGHYQHLECTNGHTAMLNWLRRGTAGPLPSPSPAKQREQLHRTLAAWRHPETGVRLDVIQRVRTVINMLPDTEILGLRLLREDREGIHITRTRADGVYEDVWLHGHDNYGFTDLGPGSRYSFEGPGGVGGRDIAHNEPAASIAAIFSSDHQALARPEDGV